MEKTPRPPRPGPRSRTSHGYSPELIVAPLLHCLGSGGASLADAERLNDEPLVRQLARVDKFAGQTQLGEWLRHQADASIAALWKLISEFIQWVIAQADPARWTFAGRAEIFFDDTQIEVHGPSFEGAKINDHGDRALSWQTCWFGPFLLGGELGSPGDVSGARTADAPDPPSAVAGAPLRFSGRQRLQQRRATTGHRPGRLHPLERELQPMDHRARAHRRALPESAWSPARQTRWRDGVAITEQHAGLRHTVAGSDFTMTLAVARWKKDGELFWRYACVAHDGQRGEADAVMARHRLKGGKEQLFKEVLRGLDLHHPPCESLVANRMFYAIAALAYNLMKAVQILCLPDACQSWTVPTLLKNKWCACPRCWCGTPGGWWRGWKWR